jgi:hypothetical protein
MSWTWATQPALDDPELLQDLADGWPDRGEAESWLATWFTDLLALGVRQVTLLEGTVAHYTMNLDR